MLLSLAALGVCGCAPFPAHYDPLSVNGRDGGGRPPSYDSLMRIGAAALAGGDAVNALSVFRRAAEISPNAPAPFVAIGDALIKLGSVDEAILAYNSALARDPNDQAAQLGLGRAYLETGRPALAAEPLSRLLTQSPDYPPALLLIGITKDLAGQYSAAQETYRHGLKYAPTNQALVVDLALSLALSANYSAAIDELAPVAMAPAATAGERQSLALIYGLQGNDAEAARLGRIDLDPASVDHNLAYYQILRTLPRDALARAILSGGTPIGAVADSRVNPTEKAVAAPGTGNRSEAKLAAAKPPVSTSTAPSGDAPVPPAAATRSSPRPEPVAAASAAVASAIAPPPTTQGGRSINASANVVNGPVGPVAQVSDAMTCSVGGQVMRLWGIRPSPGIPPATLDGFAERVAAEGPIDCRRQPASGRYRCLTATGEDVAEMALAAGLGQAPDGVTVAYRDAEAQARRAGQGLWASK